MYNINDLVHIKSTNLQGKIIKITKSSKSINYKIKTLSGINITVNEDDIEILDNKYYSNFQVQPKVSIKVSLCNEFTSNEIMLRHQTVEVAMENLDRFISKSICNKEKRVRIIHGRHGGILRNAVSKYLSNSPYVESYHIAEYYDGGYGVTIANLKYGEK